MRTPILNRLLQEIKYVISMGASEQKVLLGRWNPLRCTQKEERVVYYANMDHCGDCGKLVLENKNKCK